MDGEKPFSEAGRLLLFPSDLQTDNGGDGACTSEELSSTAPADLQCREVSVIIRHQDLVP